MEDKKMLDIIHNNCKKEQTRKQVAKKQYIQEQQLGKKWCKIVALTGIICVLIEITIVIMERVI